MLSGKPVCVVSVKTYHYNFGKGAIPGTIGLNDSIGPVGTWQTVGSTLGGGPNTLWVGTPTQQLVLQSGTYSVVDSDSATWFQNAASGGKGFAMVTVQDYGVP